MFLTKYNRNNPIALKKAKIVCNFGLSECNRVKIHQNACMFLPVSAVLNNKIHENFYAAENFYQPKSNTLVLSSVIYI